MTTQSTGGAAHHVEREVHLVRALARGDCSLDIHRPAWEHIRQRAAELLCGRRRLLPLAFECGAHGECFVGTHFGKPRRGSLFSRFEMIRDKSKSGVPIKRDSCFESIGF